MQQTRATNPQDAYWAFDPFAVVKPGDAWYEDLSARLADHRYGLGARLSKHLRPAPNASRAIRKKRGERCRILVVIDNLEKFEKREIVERAVISRAGELRDLRCHLIAFLHPADLYAPRTISASAAFQKVISLPSLPIRERKDGVRKIDRTCVAAVRALLDRRVELDSIFEDGESAVEALLRYSGGHLRDILAIAREACELFVGTKVGLAQIEAAARRLSRIHNAKIRKDDWPRLRSIAKTKDIENGPIDGYLLLHLLVLEYNGETWWDVHPFVRLDSRFGAKSPPSKRAP